MSTGSTTFWLGGGSGAGKTTLARIVAGRLDLRLLPPQLLPDLLAPLLDTPDDALWLLPTPDFAHAAVTGRGEPVPSRREAELRENRRRRDVLVTRALRERTAALGLRSVDVDGSLPVEASADRLEVVVRALPGLVRATPDERPAMRRHENEVMARQLTAWWDDLGRDAMPTAPVGPFWCECPTPGCGASLTLPVEAFLRRSAAGPLFAHAG